VIATTRFGGKKDEGEMAEVIAYTVRVHIPPSTNLSEGAMVIYVAAFETENEALEATMSNIPDGWTPSFSGMRREKG
jgi:hypothetical protein